MTRIASTIALIAAFTSVHGQRNSSDPDSLSALQEIKLRTATQSKAFAYLKELTDSIGPRLTGSNQAKVACQWGVARMKKSGLTNVHLEPFMLSRGWERGPASAELIRPFHMGLNITSYGWVGSTKKGGTEADVVLVNTDTFDEEIKKHSSTWAGKVLFLTALSPKHLNPIRSFSQLGGFLTAAAKAHAVAVIYPTGRPGTMLTHTGPAAFQDSYFPIPVVDIAQEQQTMLQRLLMAKGHVRIKINVQNTVTTGPISSNNVVGEIVGAEHPEEVVIIGAHLDSWDLGTGAIDDGFGVASVLGAADAILSQRIRPSRTLRFVLFTGEEQGLLGSLAYVRTHRAELKNAICAFVMDWGSGQITKLPLAGHDELEAAFQHYTQLVEDIANVQVDHTYLSYTDGYAFTLAGVPGIAALQNSPNYVQIGHSAADTLDKVDKKSLLIDTAILATSAFWVANYPTRLGMTWTEAQTVKALTRDNQKAMLELFGLWRFAEPKPPIQKAVAKPNAGSHLP